MKKKLILPVALLSVAGINAQINQNTSGQTGFGNAAPTNRVEITSKTGDPHHGGANGSSGLKLTNLANTVTPSGGNGKVLSTDASGNVILVTDLNTGGPGGSIFAQNGCSLLNGNTVELGDPVPGGLLSQFTTARRVHQNNNRIVFSGDQTNDMFQIGSNGNNSGASRLYVENHLGRGSINYGMGVSVLADADNCVDNIGYHATIIDKTGTSSAAITNTGVRLSVSGRNVQRGIFAQTIGTGNSPVYGADFTTQNSTGSASNVWGIKSIASSFALNTPLSACYGIETGAGGAQNNYAGSFVCNTSVVGTQTSCGVAGTSWDASVNNFGGIFQGYAINAPVSSLPKAYGITTTAGGGVINYGIKSLSRHTASSFNFGVHSTADGFGSAHNYAAFLDAGNRSNSNQLADSNVAVFARATGYMNPAAPAANIGVYASVLPVTQPTTIAWPGRNWAGYFEGDVNIIGSTGMGNVGAFALNVDGGAFMTNGTWGGSDRRFKKDIRPLESSIEKIKKLHGYTYYFKTDEFKNKNFFDTEQIGLIAQELQQVFPQLVKETNDGYLSVRYEGMIPVLLEAIKEQQQQIDELILQNQEMKQKMGSTTGVEDLTILNGFQMSQNEPNPFTHETVVKYTLPQTVSNAFMAVYDLTGKQIATFPITEKGNSSITITSEKLAAGIYIYSIVADGKVMDSKRMIVADK